MGLAAHAAGEADLVPIDLIVDGLPAGSIPADLSGGALSLDAGILAEALRDRLDGTVLERLQAAAGGAPVDAHVLDGMGIGWSYDPRMLTLSLSLPLGARKRRVISLDSRSADPLGAIETPSVFSAYVNLRTRVEAVLSFPDLQPLEAAFPLQVSVEPVANLLGWVLEAAASAELSGSFEAGLDRVRLVHDFLPAPARLTIGTFQATGADFLAARPLAGIQLLFDPLLTGLPRRSTVEEELLLESPSEVSVLLNGDLVNRRRLDAGRYLFTGMPFLRGLNELTVKTAGSSGAVLEHRYVPWDSRLLPGGDISLSLSLGIEPWQIAPPVFSGQLLYGLGSFVRMGLQLEAGADRQRGGVEILAATEAGSFRVGLAASLAADDLPDLGFLAEYQIAFPFSRTLPTFGLSARYNGERFLGPGASVSVNPDAWILSASLGQALPFSIGMSLSGSYRVGRGTGTDSGTATLAFTRSMARGTTLSLLANGRLAPASDPGLSVTVLLTSSLSDGKVLTGVRHDVTGGLASLDVQARGGSGRDEPSFSAFLDGIPSTASGRIGAGIGVRYAGRALEASLTDSFSAGGEGGAAARNATAFEAGAALALADGLVAVSAPIADSFALLVPVGNLRGQTVVAGSPADGAVAEGGGIGTISRLRSYSRAPILLEAPETPPGTDLGEAQRVLAPTYRSGIVIRAGSEPTVPAEGTLLLPDGSPARLRVGEAVRAGEREGTPLKFFTDEAGVFQLYGLQAGDYRLRLYPQGGEEAVFSILQDAQGLQRIGVLRLAAPDKED